jgi:glyoxylase-like metal-dependent hydrolase (beta-lactamase superfamily II)
MDYQITNDHRKSNTYILKINESEVVIIDIGDFDTNSFAQWLTHKNLKLRAVFLTHEHSDHCEGVNRLSEIYEFDLYCSEICATNIKDPKQNFSKYLEGIETFSVNKRCSILQDKSSIILGNSVFHVIETPGHSPGSICIITGNSIYTGDTIMKTKTPLGFPHSDKVEYKRSLLKLDEYLQNEITIYPGHGNPFPSIEKY